MNQLGRTDQRAASQGNRAMASERGAWRPVGGPAPQPRHPGPQAPAPRGAGRPQGPQYVGPPVGPYNARPQNHGSQNFAPRYAGPQQQPMPAGPARPPLGAPPAGPAAPVAVGPPAPRRRRRVGTWIGVAVVVAALGGVSWYVTYGAPAPVTAAVGECVTQSGNDQVAVVGCGDPSAKFKVAGKVENKTMIDASLFACSDVAGSTSSFWQGVEGKPGTVLCLAPLHP